MKDVNNIEAAENSDTTTGIIYNPEKDFYKGMGGELRMKAEGLFKKAKEKGISIDDVSIEVLNENKAEFPGIGNIELPSFIVKVKGKDMSSGQVIVDGKQIDYFNRYQKYIADKIENKNALKDERGKMVFENRRPVIKDNPEFILTDWEKFEIGKELIDDKEFGLEKTITGACDRIIRKLMGENDWLYPEEARLLDEEYNAVQGRIGREQQERKQLSPAVKKKATPRQISYFKQRLKNMGMNPDDTSVLNRVLKEIGFDHAELNDLSVGDMSKIIDNLNNIVPKVKDVLTQGEAVNLKELRADENTNDLKQ
ncbi:MAG: hypothetical protein ACOYWZ_23295 [Bacillota bacterium]